MDAFTMAPINRDTRTMMILVVLLVDKLFYDEFGHERPDGYAKLTVALAHEVLGNVQHFLHTRFDDLKPQTMQDRIRQERKAFQASIMFLNEILVNPKASTIPPLIRQKLIHLMPQELAAFESWLRAHPSETPDAACEAMLQTWKEAKNR